MNSPFRVIVAASTPAPSQGQLSPAGAVQLVVAAGKSNIGKRPERAAQAQARIGSN